MDKQVMGKDLEDKQLVNKELLCKDAQGKETAGGRSSMQLKRQILSVATMQGDNTVEQPIDCDITLPDYLADIQKILKCMAIPGVSSVQISGNRVAAEGSVLVRVIYLDENDKISTYDQSLPFMKYVETTDAEGAIFADCNPKPGYVNCRAVNQRRVDVHGAVSLCFSTMSRRETAVITDSCDLHIERRTMPLCVANSVADTGRFFSVTEVENLGAHPPVLSIVRTSGYALVNEVKVIKDKALVKGDVIITIAYTSLECEGIELVDIKLPISQIVDVAGLDEDEIIDTTLRVMTLNVIPKTDSTGDYKLLDISVKLMAELHALKEYSFTGITDAYSTRCPLELSVDEKNIFRYSEKIDENVLVRRDLDLPVAECIDVSNVADVWCYDTDVSYKYSDGTLEIFGTTNVGVIGKIADGGFTFYERNVSFSYTKTIDGVSAIRCNPHVTVLNQNTVKNPDGGIDVRIEIQIKANVFSVERVSLVSDIVECENSEERNTDGPALIIYFAEESETIWDIARRYNTTVEAVKRENEICDEVILKPSMLLIPR